MLACCSLARRQAPQIGRHRRTAVFPAQGVARIAIGPPVRFRGGRGNRWLWKPQAGETEGEPYVDNAGRATRIACIRLYFATRPAAGEV